MGEIKGILFDLGNTLIYFEGAWPQVFAKADRELLDYLRAAGLQLDAERFLTEFRARLNAYYAQREAEFVEYTTDYILRSLLAELGFEGVPDETIEPALARLYAVSQAHWKVEADAHPTLERLKEQGYGLGIISNAMYDADVQTLVDNANIRSYFDFVLSSAAYGLRKPNPRIFEQALEQWGLSADQVVMVGDRLGADILGARNAGIFSVWITRRAETPANRDHLDTIQPDATIATLSELPDLLAGLSRE